jgi:hypothetical protein
MAYVGNNLTVQQYAPQIAYFSGNGSTTAFTLPVACVSAAQIIVVVANVPQNPSSAYTVSGTTLTFTSAPPSGTNNVWVEYTSLQTNTVVPSPGTVQSSSFASGASEFASGTKLLFQQTASPTGWTKVTANDNAALRVVSGAASTGGSVNFTTAFASQAVAGTVGTSGSTTATGTVGNTTLTTTTMPSHAHSVSDPTHAHSLYDPGHAHTMPIYTYDYAWEGQAGKQWVAGGRDNSGANYIYPGTSGAGTGMGVYGAATGIGVSANGSSAAHNHSLTMDAHTHTGGTFTGTAINLAVKYVDAIVATKD